MDLKKYMAHCLRTKKDGDGSQPNEVKDWTKCSAEPQEFVRRLAESQTMSQAMSLIVIDQEIGEIPNSASPTHRSS